MLRSARSIPSSYWHGTSTAAPACIGTTARLPAELGKFLSFLVKRRRALHVYVLDWDYPMVYGTDREFPPIYGLGWKPDKRIHLRYDNTHPTGGSHHQKIVVVDDALAFSGGLDLTTRRWDTCEHLGDNPKRLANDAPYPPFHDTMAAVDGEAARVLARSPASVGTSRPVRRYRPAARRPRPWPERSSRS